MVSQRKRVSLLNQTRVYAISNEEVNTFFSIAAGKGRTKVEEDGQRGRREYILSGRANYNDMHVF